MPRTTTASTLASAIASDTYLAQPQARLGFRLGRACVLALTLCVTPRVAAADDVYQEPDRFVAEAFAGHPPPPQILWLTGTLREDAQRILGHAPDALRVRYWRAGARSAWILEEIGKDQPITAGFVVEAGALLTTFLLVRDVARGEAFEVGRFELQLTLWLWFTVLFANFAEAMAEGRSKAQAASLRGLKKQTWAKKLQAGHEPGTPRSAMDWHPLEADSLRKGDLVLIEAGDNVPADGEVIDGVASVDESAITGESAPVIRESGGDVCAVTGGTRVLSDWVVVRVTANPGETFVDRMIAMVENAKRQKTPNEIALTILLVALTIVFLGVVATLLPFSAFGVAASGGGEPVRLVVLVALLVCLIPTTIAGLLSAIGVAGMSRLMQANVVATSGRAVEAAGDVDVLLLDKTGTITLGNRQASAFIPAPGVKESDLADAAQLASLADETPEGRSIVVLAKQRFNLRERDVTALGVTRALEDVGLAHRAGDRVRDFSAGMRKRLALGRILPRVDDRFFLLHLIHNNHTVGERRWDSQLSPDYAPLFKRMRMVDGLVTLTFDQFYGSFQYIGISGVWCEAASGFGPLAASPRDHLTRP